MLRNVLVSEDVFAHTSWIKQAEFTKLLFFFNSFYILCLAYLPFYKITHLMKYIFLILSLFLSVFSIFSSPVSASDSGYNGDNWYITMPMVLNSSTSSYSFGVSNNSTPFADKSRSLVLVNEQTSTNIDTMSYGPQILCVAPQKNEQTIVSKLSVRMLSYRTTADRTDADYSFDIDSGGNRFRSMPVLNR